MLEHGVRGDGLRRPWMDEMRRDGVKLTSLTFEFDWKRGGHVLEHWRLVSAEYFDSYNYASPPMAESQIATIKVSGSAVTLQAEALERAKHGFWIEDPGHQHPAHRKGTGYRIVSLAENEWLPVQVFPLYGQYEPRTTPLMHAAALGDVARLTALLVPGAKVNAVSRDGSTALVYAVGANAGAVRALLEAGADVNAGMKGGGNALTAAVVTDHAENVSILLKAGADPSSRGAEEQSALSIGLQRHYTDIAELLRQAGATQ